MRMVARTLLLAVLLSMTFMADASNAAAEEDYSALVVQNRIFDPTHEFGVSLGWLPLDAFTKGATVSGQYTLHFSESWAWEIVQFYWSFQYDTELSTELEAFDLAPTPFEVVDYFATSSAVWKPLYWKGSWLNDAITYGELFFALGGGYGWLTRSQRPALDVGGGFRVYTGGLFSFRFDLRYLMFFGDQIFEEFDVKDELWLGLGTSVTF